MDLVEIGIPFSDPLADGPTIQESSKIALENGMSIEKLFSQLEKHNPDKSPVLLMGYLNPVMQYGLEKFCERCARSRCGRFDHSRLTYVYLSNGI